MKWSQSILCAVGVVLAGCALFYALQPREPVYQGKSFSVWAKDLYPKRPLSRADLSKFFQKRDQANNAVRQMGTKALAFLVKMLHQRDSFLKVQLMKLAAKQNVIRFYFTPASTINQGAAHDQDTGAKYGRSGQVNHRLWTRKLWLSSKGRRKRINPNSHS